MSHKTIDAHPTYGHWAIDVPSSQEMSLGFLDFMDIVLGQKKSQKQSIIAQEGRRRRKTTLRRHALVDMMCVQLKIQVNISKSSFTNNLTPDRLCNLVWTLTCTKKKWIGDAYYHFSQLCNKLIHLVVMLFISYLDHGTAKSSSSTKLEGLPHNYVISKSIYCMSVNI